MLGDHSLTDKPGCTRPPLPGRGRPSVGPTSQAPVDPRGGEEAAAWPPSAFACPLCGFGAAPAVVRVVFGNHT